MDQYFAQRENREHEYAALREKKVTADRQLRQYFWIQLLLGALLFGLSLFASADMSRKQELHSAGKFYWAMNAAGIQIILGVVTAMFAVLAGYGKRWATFILIILFAALAVWAVSGKQIALSMGNLAIAVFGIALNLWVQRAFSTDEMLKEFPGYPHFTVIAEKSEYHPSLVVAGRQASGQGEMASVEGFTDAPKETAKEPLTPSAGTVLDEISAPERQTASGQTLSAPADAVLEQVGAAAEAGRAAEALPELSPDAVLSDMTAEGSRRMGGDPAALPDPDEVIRRLQEMRDARSQAAE